MSPTLRKYLSIFALSLAGGSIYTLPYIKYVFYDTQIEVMGITNTQSGFLLSMYALGCIISYIPGGLITDKISPRKAIAASLFGTAGLGLLYALTFSYTISLVIWFLFALTTAFVFWTALMKAIGMAGDSQEQARLYGIYYAGNGIAAAVINSISLKAFSMGSSPRESLFYAVAVMSASIFVSGLLVLFFLKDGKVESRDEDKFDFSAVKDLSKNPMLWCFSIIVFCGYAIYSSTSYFTPYLTNVVGLSVEESGVYSIIRSYLFYLLAPFAGYLADRILQFHSQALPRSVHTAGRHHRRSARSARHHVRHGHQPVYPAARSPRSDALRPGLFRCQGSGNPHQGRRNRHRPGLHHRIYAGLLFLGHVRFLAGLLRERKRLCHDLRFPGHRRRLWAR